MASVLVLDGTERSALATVRALGRRGHHLLVGSTARSSIASASRYCEAAHVLPDPLRRPEELADAVVRLCDRLGVEVLLPMTDASLLAVLPRRDRLSTTVLPFPSADRFRAISDKHRLLEAAAGVGVQAPPQRVLGSPAAAKELAPDDVAFPLVVKPSRSVTLAPASRRKLPVRTVFDWSSLSETLAAVPEGGYPVLLQRRIVGEGVGVFLLLWQGELLASFAHRRLREKPVSGGVSVLRESIRAPEGLVSRSAALLREFDWRGVAMIEYRVETETGLPYLMEVNGRFWGSLQLAIDAGVDFPSLLVDLALGNRVRPVHDYRVGVRTRWLWGDVDHLLERLRRPPPGLDAEVPPGRLRAVRDFLASFGPGTECEVFRLSDPRPFLVESARWFRPPEEPVS